MNKQLVKAMQMLEQVRHLHGFSSLFYSLYQQKAYYAFCSFGCVTFLCCFG
jgi:hypothetical protein